MEGGGDEAFPTTMKYIFDRLLEEIRNAWSANEHIGY